MTEREKLIVTGTLPAGFVPLTRDEAYLMLALGMQITIPAEEDNEEATEISITDTLFFPPLRDWEIAVCVNAGLRVPYPQTSGESEGEDDIHIEPTPEEENPTT